MKELTLSELQRFDRAKYLAKLLNEFKLKVMDSVMSGESDEQEDQKEFLLQELELFLVRLEKTIKESL
jgi:hypothetical protein